MFTGLVQAVGEVSSHESTPTGVRLGIDAGDWDHAPREGDSLSVSGCCLTLASVPRDGHLEFDVIAETLAKTTLGTLAPGARVNLEHAATPTTLLGGHMVQGHVDGVGEVTRVDADPQDWRVEIVCPEGLESYIVPKGSITLDGVSLTVTHVSGRTFGVALIPTTLRLTTLDELRPGSRVNLETDIITKTVVRTMANVLGAERDA